MPRVVIVVVVVVSLNLVDESLFRDVRLFSSPSGRERKREERDSARTADKSSSARARWIRYVVLYKRIYIACQRSSSRLSQPAPRRCPMGEGSRGIAVVAVEMPIRRRAPVRHTRLLVQLVTYTLFYLLADSNNTVGPKTRDIFVPRPPLPFPTLFKIRQVESSR